MTEFAAEILFHIGGFPVTNTFITTLCVDAILLGGAYVVTRRLSLIPSGIQNAGEMVIGGFYDFVASIAHEKAPRIFPYFMTFFLFIIVANWMGLIPGFGTIGIREHDKLIPFLRGATTDINVTFGLALVSVVATHLMSVQILGIRGYLSRYFSINPIYLFVGFLEIISEITKIISLSFRLFGNVFAGEVVLSTVSKLFAFGFPIPFMLLETIVGFVQALVFSMLTFVFMVILTTSHNEDH